jgi:AraC-like DNA-binding protein
LGLPELVSELGGNLNEMAEEIGLELPGPRAAEHFLAVRQVHELTNLAAERLGRKDLGLLWGARSDPTRLGPLHVAVSNAETGRQAIELIASFLHINFPTGKVFLKARPGKRQDLLGLRSLLKNPPPLIQFYERRIASLHVILKLVCGENYRPDEVWFTHDQQSPMAAYRRVFGIQPSFGMPENGIVISRRILDELRPGSNEQVREMAVSYLRSLAPPACPSFAAETSHMVSVLMRSSNCTVSQTARALGMHVRTLQRRLENEDANFETIKDEVRKEMARSFLADRNISLSDAAFALHYSSLSAFTRSCQRWFGQPPGEIRRRRSNGARAKVLRRRANSWRKTG